MKNSALVTLFLLFGFLWFELNVFDNLLPSATTEYGCFRKKESKLRVKSCLAEKRPATDCLAEARALCLKDYINDGSL